MTTSDGLLQAAEMARARKSPFNGDISVNTHLEILAQDFEALAAQELEREPTDSMLLAGGEATAWESNMTGEQIDDTVRSIYKAMRTASLIEHQAVVPHEPMLKEPQIMQMWGIENKYIPVVRKADYDALRAHAEALRHRADKAEADYEKLQGKL